MAGRVHNAVDLAFTTALPKVELHAHLSGSVSRECLRKLWLRKKERDPNCAIPDPMEVMPAGKVDYGLETQVIQSGFSYFVLGLLLIGSRFFTVFSNLIYHLCSDLNGLRYSTRSVLQDFQRDGVRYLELRTTPRESHEHGVSKEQYVSTVLDVIDEFKNDQMSTFLIFSVDRTKSAANALDVVDLAIKYRDRGVVAVELGGDPSRGDVSLFAEAFSKAREHGLRITLHFAETEFSSSPTELNALLSFQPDRLGHVIHVPDGFKEEIVRRKLSLELCLSCNVHAKLIQGWFPDHHFGYWRNQDCPVILCTDDVGFFCSPLSNEYLLAAEHFQLNRATILEMSKKAITTIFGGEKEKSRLYSLIADFEEQLKQR